MKFLEDSNYEIYEVKVNFKVEISKKILDKHIVLGSLSRVGHFILQFINLKIIWLNQKNPLCFQTGSLLRFYHIF